MNEQLEALLETLNTGLAPVMNSLAEFTGYSNTFIKENFNTIFYKAGQYLFWKDLLEDYGLYVFAGMVFGFFATIILADDKNLSFSKGAKIMLTIGFIGTMTLFLLVNMGDIILYNTAREAWILDALSEYIQ